MSGQSKADRNEVGLFIISGRVHRFLFLYFGRKVFATLRKRCW